MCVCVYVCVCVCVRERESVCVYDVEVLSKVVTDCYEVMLSDVNTIAQL